MRYLLSILLCCWSALVYSAEPNELPPDIQSIISRGKLVVAVINEEIPPFVTLHKGQLEGYDVKLAHDIAERLDVQVSFNREAKTFDDVVKQVAAHKADIAISLISRTLPRALKVNFSDPYLLLHQALLVNRIKAIQLKLKANPKAALNQPQATIAVLQDSSYVTFAKNYYPKATIIPYKNLNQAMLDVKNGKILTVLFDEIQIQNWLYKHPEAHLYVEMLILSGQIDPISMVLPWQSTHFLRWINTYLADLEDDANHKQVVNHYLKDNKWRNQ